MTIDRSFLRRLRSRMQEIVDSAAREFGVTITVGSASFTETNARFKVEVSALTADGKAVSEQAEDFKRCCFMFGLKPEDLGREFRHGNQVFRITGAKLTCRKYPILAQNCSGKTYKFTAEMVKAALLRSGKISSE